MEAASGHHLVMIMPHLDWEPIAGYSAIPVAAFKLTVLPWSDNFCRRRLRLNTVEIQSQSESPPFHTKHASALSPFSLYHIPVFKINPLMTFDVQRQILVLKFVLVFLFRHVKPYYTFLLGSLNVKMHNQMLSASSISFRPAGNVPIPGPSVPCSLTIRPDLLRIAKNFDTPRIGLDSCVRLVKVVCFRICAEDFLVQKPRYAACRDHTHDYDGEVE